MTTTQRTRVAQNGHYIGMVWKSTARHRKSAPWEFKAYNGKMICEFKSRAEAVKKLKGYVAATCPLGTGAEHTDITPEEKIRMLEGLAASGRTAAVRRGAARRLSELGR